MNEGWVKLWRKMKDNPLFGDSVWVHLTVYLLIESSHKPKQSMFEGEVITLLPGQVITGRRKLAKTLGCSDSRIERLLKRMEIGQQIEQQKKQHSRLISIINWKLYQGSEPQDEPQVNHNRTTSEPQVNTVLRSKEVKKLEVKNKDKIKHLDFVHLSQIEYSTLLTDYGKSQTAELIRRLNDYIGSKGDKYKSHYFTLLNFARRDNIKKITPAAKFTHSTPPPSKPLTAEELAEAAKFQEQLAKIGNAKKVMEAGK